MAPDVGDVVDGRYELRRAVARGGMALVFEATHLHTGRAVALKVLTEKGAEREAMHERLRREARALGLVRHPNVVEVLDANKNAEYGPWVVLEMLEGRALDGILAARRRLAALDVAHVGRQICDALSFAHARGVLHRDVKPSNVFVAWDPLDREIVKLIDFGIAWSPGSDARVTQRNEVLGTAAYMAPEQMLGRDVDVRSDVYALGATLFECATGAVPYAGPFPQVLVQVSAASPPPSVCALAPDVPPALAAVIERAIAKSAADRFPDASSFAVALVTAVGAEEDFGAYPSRRGQHELALLGGRPDEAGRLEASRAAAAPATMTSEAGRAKAPTGDPRRRYARRAYVTAVLLLAPDGDVLEGRTEDLSEGGCLVMTTAAYPAGTPMRVRFALPTGQLVAVDGVVRWTREAHEKVVLGIEFVGLPPDTRGAIAGTLASRVTG